MTTLAPKPMRASRISIAQLMQPEHANPAGNVHGGYIMKLVDECGALACMRHAARRVVTVAIDRMTFRQPIKIGDLVILSAEVTYVGRTSLEAAVHVEAENPISGEVTYVGRTSLEAAVHVEAENPISGEKTHTNTAYLVYVAIGEDGLPVEVPPLLAENAEEREKLAAGQARQRQRLEQK